MTIDKDDEVKIEKIVMKTVVDALEQVVLPRIQDVEDKMEKGFQEGDEKFKKVDERFNDVDASLNRVETLAKSEIKYVDDLSDRVLKLEPKKA